VETESVIRVNVPVARRERGVLAGATSLTEAPSGSRKRPTAGASPYGASGAGTDDDLGAVYRDRTLVTAFGPDTILIADVGLGGEGGIVRLEVDERGRASGISR